MPSASPGFVGEVGEPVDASFSAQEVSENAQVHLGAGRFAVLAVFEDEDLVVGPCCIRAVPENAAHDVAQEVIDGRIAVAELISG